MSRCMRRGRLGYITLVVGGEVGGGEVAVEVVMGGGEGGGGGGGGGEFTRGGTMLVVGYRLLLFSLLAKLAFETLRCLRGEILVGTEIPGGVCVWGGGGWGRGGGWGGERLTPINTTLSPSQ